MKEANVEEIMAEIKKTIMKNENSEDIFLPLDAESDVENEEYFNIDEFYGYLDQINQQHEVSYYFTIEHRGLKSTVKRAIRKILAFLELPMLQQQNSFNAAVVNSMNCVKKYMVDMNENIGESDVFMNEENIKKYFLYQEQAVEKMQTKIIVLEQRIEQLEKKISEK